MYWRPADLTKELNSHVNMCFRSSQSLLDISGFATIPETPCRPTAVAPPSLHVLKRPPLEGEYISVTDSSGSRVYLKQKEDTGTKVKIPSGASSVLLVDWHTFWTVLLCWIVPVDAITQWSNMSPGGWLQNSARLPGCTGAVSSANTCVERPRGREGEWAASLCFIYDVVDFLHLTW